MWKCEFLQEKKDWTVGDVRLLSCRSEQPHQLFGELKIDLSKKSNDSDGTGGTADSAGSNGLVGSDKNLGKIPKEHPHANMALKILKVKSLGPQSIDLYVTGYKTGLNQNVSFQINDGKSSVKVEPLTWEIKSILTKDQPAQPFGPFPAESLQLPYSYWFFLGAIVFLVLFLLALPVKKYWERKKLIRELRDLRESGWEGEFSLTEGLSANGKKGSFITYNQFSKAMRRIHIKYNSLEYLKKYQAQPTVEFYNELKQAFLMFVTQKFIVLAHKWTVSEILSDIKKRHKNIYPTIYLELKKVLYEFNQTKDAELCHADCLQIFNMSQAVVAHIKKAEDSLE